MEAIVSIIVAQASLWGPAVAAIFGIILTVAKAIGALRQIKEDSSMKDLRNEMHELVQENQEITRCNKLLLDEITRIKDYADHRKE